MVLTGSAPRPGETQPTAVSKLPATPLQASAPMRVSYTLTSGQAGGSCLDLPLMLRHYRMIRFGVGWNMARSNVVSMQKCLDTFAFDHQTGLLFWKNRPEMPNWWNTRYAGKQAFTSLDTDGYYNGRLDGRPVRAQYVVWAMHFGTDFPEIIDHVNRIRTDNRLENLRALNPSGNAANRSASNLKPNIGVYQTKEGNWRARSRRNGILHNIGTFKTLELANEAYINFTKSIRHHN
jgi:hypothetical protein